MFNFAFFSSSIRNSELVIYIINWNLTDEFSPLQVHLKISTKLLSSQLHNFSKCIENTSNAAWNQYQHTHIHYKYRDDRFQLKECTILFDIIIKNIILFLSHLAVVCQRELLHTHTRAEEKTDWNQKIVWA